VKQLKKHQRQARWHVNRCKTRGKVIIPTGGGKSFIQAYTLSDFQRKDRSKGWRIHAIIAPRIQLALQHLYSFQQDKNACRLADYIPFALHSGGTGDEGNQAQDILVKGIEYSNLASGTSDVSLIQQFEIACKLKTDLVVFGTYHSFSRLIKALETLKEEYPHIAGICHFDECQYLVSNGFGSILDDTPFEKNIFWTATQKMTKDEEKGVGMQNVKKWGETLYRVTPKVLINAGVILRPRLHVLTVNTLGCELKDAEGVVIETFKVHREHTNPKLPVKMIVNSQGTKFIDYILNVGRKFHSAYPDVDIFAISSFHGALYYNSQTHTTTELKRKEWLDLLRTTKRDSVILHYDIISEGIDVDGITGTLIMRNAGLGKLTQIIGRTLRLYGEDRTRHTNSELNVNNLEDWIKPAGIISVAAIFGDGGMSSDDMQTVQDLVKALRTSGFNPMENVIIHTPKGKDEEEENPDRVQSELEKKQKMLTNFEEIFKLKDNMVETLAEIRILDNADLATPAEW
jgi:superfamily II DNA or RNA helicase